MRETKAYKAIQRTIQKRKLSLTEEQLKVLHSAAVDPTIKRTEMVREKELIEGVVIGCISTLKEAGLLGRKGGKRYGEWVVYLDGWS